MHFSPTGETLYCLDVIRIGSGEILSLCGNFDGPWYRARLSHFPHSGSERIIEGVAYRKATYETGYQISSCEKVLDLPGDQHFLVHRDQIDRVHRARDAFEGVPEEFSRNCQLFIEMLRDSCGVGIDQHGLTGSGATHSISSTSDFDWVVYQRDPSLIGAYVRSNSEFESEFTFTLEHVRRKYSCFEGFRPEDIQVLFEARWIYVRFKNLRISLCFVDPSRRVDSLLSPLELGGRVEMRGVVADSVGSHHMPYIVPINCEGKIYSVLTWLHLYNGAFGEGDVVDFSGRERLVDGQAYVFVEGPQDYVRRSR